MSAQEIGLKSKFENFEIGVKTQHVITCAQRRAPMALRAPRWRGARTKTGGQMGPGCSARQKEVVGVQKWTGRSKKVHTSTELDREGMPWVWGVDWQG